MTEEPFEIIADENGEVLAATEEERVAALQRVAMEIIQITQLADQLSPLYEMLNRLMRVGESVVDSGYALTCEMGGTPPRQVNKQEIQMHEESLKPLGLAAHEQVKVTQVYPGVGAFTTTKARTELARVGLTADQFLLGGGAPQPKIKLYRPKG